MSVVLGRSWACVSATHHQLDRACHSTSTLEERSGEVRQGKPQMMLLHSKQTYNMWMATTFAYMLYSCIIR